MHKVVRGQAISVAFALAFILSLLLAATALADGARRLELNSLTGPPKEGIANTLVVTFTEGDHPVEGATVTLIGGMGGSHEEHGMGGGSSEAATPFEVVAKAGEKPGEYVGEVRFSRAGDWTLWVAAEKGGKFTEANYTLSVAAAPVTETPPTLPQEAPVDEAPVPGVVEEVPAESAGGHAGMSEDEMAGHGGVELGSETVAEAEGGAHAGSGGEVNWFVIAGFIVIVAVATVAANLLKRHLRRQMALGNLQAQGAGHE